MEVLVCSHGFNADLNPTLVFGEEREKSSQVVVQTSDLWSCGLVSMLAQQKVIHLFEEQPGFMALQMCPCGGSAWFSHVAPCFSEPLVPVQLHWVAVTLESLDFLDLC